VRAAILILLAEAPFNGYQLIHEIAQRSGGIWQPSPGSVYPALQLLQDEGLVQAEETEGRRVFCLSEAGRTYVEERREELAAAWEAVTGTVDDATLELRSLFDQVGMALKQVVHVGTPGQLAEAGRLLTTTRRQLYRILADEQAGDEGA
jgi:DNA-binding PadR family transcriptional regulator